MGELREQLVGNINHDKRAVIIKKLRETDLRSNLVMERRNRKNRTYLNERL
ncbi:conserved hypothetical protein [Candidatus Desulfosporosinus infrequens]|uniref:Uncharacterized protein n=1 Tax=Candidatus Desulfosporosinus infrequens TaxID=2043169 RepID=A0A2U3LYV2_9FIRM|nr:conserved hypothetical protein [Candidatus Desulfosporosinus infrequens]